MPPTIDARSGGRASLRWWLFYIHLITGITFGLYFVVIGLTGSIIVFEPELIKATMPPPTSRSADAPRLPLNRMVERIEAAYPGRRIAYVRWVPYPEDRYRVRLKPDPHQGGIDKNVFFDRSTGEVLGEAPWWLRWLEELHFYLLSGTTGLRVNGIGALLLALASISGLVVWWPGIRRWGSGFRINVRSNWQGVNYDAHKVIGAVALVILMAFAFSGFYFGFPQLFERPVNYPEPPESIIRDGLPPVDLDELVGRAHVAVPDALVTQVSLPASARDTYKVRIKVQGEAFEFGRSQVYFDRYGGELRGIYDSRSLSVPQRVFVEWMAPIHYGLFGGLFTRILWAIAGVVPLVLFISGCLMWWNRSLVKVWRRRRVPAPAYQPSLDRAAES